MASEDDFKIKGAAVASIEEGADESGEQKTESEALKPQLGEDVESTAKVRDDSPEEGEPQAKNNDGGTITQEELLQRYRWCKCICDPAQFPGRDHYYTHMDTQQSMWEEPSEPYWIWDAEKQDVDGSGLQYPGAAAAAAAAEPSQATSSEPDPNYAGYNPKIHGNYDPTAPYAQYHNKKREEETVGEQAPAPNPAAITDYAAAGTFNRFTGQFQGGDKSADRHSDFNKSGRQLNAYFDVDAAANAHDGRSLKEERRNQKLTGKEIKDLAEKRRAKKEKKRMDFYKS